MGFGSDGRRAIRAVLGPGARGRVAFEVRGALGRKGIVFRELTSGALYFAKQRRTEAEAVAEAGKLRAVRGLAGLHTPQLVGRHRRTLVQRYVEGRSLETLARGCHRGELPRARLAEFLEAAGRSLARLHTSSAALGEWISLDRPYDRKRLEQRCREAVRLVESTGFERYRRRGGARDLEAWRGALAGERIAAMIEAVAGTCSPCEPSHGDYHAENLLFTELGECVIVDWESLSFGPPLLDLSRLLYRGALTGHRSELVRHYLDERRRCGVPLDLDEGRLRDLLASFELYQGLQALPWAMKGMRAGGDPRFVGVFERMLDGLGGPAR